MNWGFIYFLGVALVLSLIGLAITIVVIMNKEKDDPENQSILFNFMPKYTDGYAMGIIDKIETSPVRTKIVFFPRDLNYIKLVKDNKTVIEPQELFALNKNIITLPVGQVSSYRNIIIAFPPKIEDIPEKLKEEPFGKLIMKFIENKETEAETVEIMRARLGNQKKILEKTAGLQIAQDLIAKSKEIIKDLQNNPMQRPEKEEE